MVGDVIDCSHLAYSVQGFHGRVLFLEAYSVKTPVRRIIAIFSYKGYTIALKQFHLRCIVPFVS